MSKIFSRCFQFQFPVDGIHEIFLLLRNVEVLAPLKWFYMVILGWSMGSCSSRMYMNQAIKSTHLCSNWWSWWGIHCGTWDPECSSNLWSFSSISWSSCRSTKALGCPISSYKLIEQWISGEGFFSSVPFQRVQNEMQEIGEQVLENRNQVGWYPQIWNQILLVRF
jgi:hypothetical protein